MFNDRDGLKIGGAIYIIVRCKYENNMNYILISSNNYIIKEQPNLKL